MQLCKKYTSEDKPEMEVLGNSPLYLACRFTAGPIEQRRIGYA